MTYPNEVQAFYYDTLNWCGCGNPEEALGLMRDVLRLFKERSDANRLPTPAHFFVPDVASFLNDRAEGWRLVTQKIDDLLGDGPLGLSYLYMLDALGLTEHGGYVGGCWLTAEGERVLALLDADLDAAMSEEL